LSAWKVPFFVWKTISACCTSMNFALSFSMISP
jgi:hypothetical protein